MDSYYLVAPQRRSYTRPWVMAILLGTCLLFPTAWFVDAFYLPLHPHSNYHHYYNDRTTATATTTRRTSSSNNNDNHHHNNSPRRRHRPSTQRSHHNSTTIRAFNQRLHHFVQTANATKHCSVAELAEQRLLLRMQTTTKNNSTNPIDVVSFNIVLNAWAKQHSWKAALRADALFQQLVSLSHNHNHNTNSTTLSRMTPDSYSYAALLHAYAKSGGKIPAAQRAQTILHDYVQQQQEASWTTDICHNAVMDAWAVSGHPQAGIKAEAILRQLVMVGKNNKATLVSYNACLKAYAKTGQAHEAERILQELIISFQPNNNNKKQQKGFLQPDRVSFTTVMDAWAKSGAPEAPSKAQALLHEMEQRGIQPDVVAYTAVLAAGATNVVGDLLGRMEKYAQKPNAAFFNTWIHIMKKASKDKHKAPEDAQKLLNYMKNAYQKGNTSLKPCRVTYTAVMALFAQVGNAERAEELLNELEDLWKRTGDDSYRPSARTFVSVLNAWAKSDSYGVVAVKHAYELLSRMETLYQETGAEDLIPNSVVFAQIFQILSNSREADSAEKAVALLRRMNELHEQGHHDVRPDSTTMSYFLNTLTKAGVENVVELASHILEEVESGYAAGMGHLKPTSLLYSAVLQAYAKSRCEEGAKLAEKLLQRTKEMYKEGKLYAKPNVMFYNAVIDAHARSGCGIRAAERAEILLAEMESRSLAGDLSLEPKTRSYNAVILAWRNSNSTEAPHRVERLLERMIKRWQDAEQDCKPDRVTFNSIIGVWANSQEEDAGEHAESVLNDMLHLYKAGHTDLKPDLYSYNTCIHAYARSGKADRAQSLYEKMVSTNKDLAVTPDIITYTSLKHAWKSSFSPDAESALKSLESLINKHARANHPRVAELASHSIEEKRNSSIGTLQLNITLATS